VPGTDSQSGTQPTASVGRRLSSRRRSEEGYAMAALLTALALMGIIMSAAMPAWQNAARREREAELVFRGEQYARAIQLFQRKYANTLPPSLDVLINERFLRKKYVDPITHGEFQLLGSAQAAGATATATPGRGQTGSGASGNPRASLETLGRQTGGVPGGGAGGLPGGGRGTATPGAGRAGTAGSGGIMGVTSRSTEKSLRLYQGRGVYNEWAFVPVQRVANPGDTVGQGGPAGARGRGTPQDGGRGGTGLRPGATSGRPTFGGATGGTNPGGPARSAEPLRGR
jgi:type II secretory pathway pseudopilin PulG